MATTLISIFEQSLGLSLRNRRTSIAEEAGELILVINRLLTEAFADAIEINPEFFGFVDDVVFSGNPVNGWPRPARAMTVYRIEGVIGQTTPPLGGTEIQIAPERDKESVRFHPSVFERGRVFYSGTSPESPTAGTLRFFYARRPTLLLIGAPVTTDIDSGFPDEMVPLLIYGVAIYLAQKDSRTDELQVLSAQFELWKGLWQRYVEQTTLNIRYRWAPRRMVTPGTEVITQRPAE